MALALLCHWDVRVRLFSAPFSALILTLVSGVLGIALPAQAQLYISSISSEQERWAKEVETSISKVISGQKTLEQHDQFVKGREAVLSKQFANPEKSPFFDMYYVRESIPGGGLSFGDRSLHKNFPGPFAEFLKNQNPEENQGQIQRLWKLFFIKRRITDSQKWRKVNGPIPKNSTFSQSWINQNGSNSLFNQPTNLTSTTAFTTHRGFKFDPADPLENLIPQQMGGVFSQTPPQYYPAQKEGTIVQKPISLDQQLKGVQAEIEKVQNRLGSIRLKAIQRARKIQQEFEILKFENRVIGDYIQNTQLTDADRKVIASLKLTDEQYQWIEQSNQNFEQLGLDGAPADMQNKLKALLASRAEKTKLSPAVQNQARRLRIPADRIGQFVRMLSISQRPYFDVMQKYGATWKKGVGWDILKLRLNVSDLSNRSPLFLAISNYFSPQIASDLADPNRKVAVRVEGFVLTPPLQIKGAKPQGKISVWTEKRFLEKLEYWRVHFNEAADDFLRASAEMNGAADRLADGYLKSFWSIRLPGWVRYISPAYAAYDASRNAMNEHQYDNEGRRGPEIRLESAYRSMLNSVESFKSLGADRKSIEPYMKAMQELNGQDLKNNEAGMQAVLLAVVAQPLIPISWEFAGLAAAIWAGETLVVGTSVFAISGAFANGFTTSVFFSMMPGVFSAIRSAVVAIPKSAENGTSWSEEAIGSFADALPGTLAEGMKMGFFAALAPGAASGVRALFGSVELASGVYATIEIGTAYYFAGKMALHAAKEFKPCLDSWKYVNGLKDKPGLQQEELNKATARAWTKCTEFGFDAVATVVAFAGARNALKQMRRAREEGGLWFKPKKKDGPETSRIERAAQDIDQLITDLQAKAQADGKHSVPTPGKSATELVGGKPTTKPITQQVVEWVDGVKSTTSNAVKNPVQTLKTHLETKLSESNLRKLEHALKEVDLTRPNSARTKSALEDIADVLWKDEPVGMTQLYAAVMKRGLKEMINELNVNAPAKSGPWGKMTEAAGGTGRFFADQIAPRMRKGLQDVVRLLHLKFPRVNWSRFEKIPDRVVDEFINNGHDAAYKLFETEFGALLSRKEFVGKLDVHWRQWIKSTWDLGVYTWMTWGLVDLWKKGYSDELPELEKIKNEVARDIAKNYQRDLFLQDLCEAWLATYVNKKPTDAEITQAIEGFVLLADDVGAAAGKMDVRPSDMRIREARETLERVAHERNQPLP